MKIEEINISGGRVMTSLALDKELKDGSYSNSELRIKLIDAIINL